MIKKLAIVFGVLLIAASAFAAFTRSGNTVSDDTNNLVWTRSPARELPWAEMETYAGTLDPVGLWCLPTRAELLSTVVSTNSPQIDSAFAIGHSPSNWSLWTSEEVTEGDYSLSARAYFVFFSDGRAYTTNKRSYHAALIVRGDGYLLDSTGAYLRDSVGLYLQGGA